MQKKYLKTDCLLQVLRAIFGMAYEAALANHHTGWKDLIARQSGMIQEHDSRSFWQGLVEK